MDSHRRLFLLLGLAYPRRSPSRADGQTEIDHLMQFVETSDCMFDRNGSLYGSREAGAHIRKKYAHA